MGAGSEPLPVYGDSGYGSGSVLDTLERAGANILCKVKAPVAPAGRFTKDDFRIDVKLGAVVCAAGRTAWLREVKGGQVARFGRACQACPLFERCTTASTGRTIGLGPHEQELARGRERQTDPAWQANYTATRPKIERKIGPFDATPARRQTCPCPRPREGERGLQCPRRGDQACPPRHARCHHPQPLCCHERLKRHMARKTSSSDTHQAEPRRPTARHPGTAP